MIPRRHDTDLVMTSSDYIQFPWELGSLFFIRTRFCTISNCWLTDCPTFSVHCPMMANTMSWVTFIFIIIYRVAIQRFFFEFMCLHLHFTE